MTLTLVAPEIVDDLPDDWYHADPDSLSSSQARALLNDGAAQWNYDRQQPRGDTKAFDHGHAAHTLILGNGAPLFALEPAVHGLKDNGSIADSPAATKAWKEAAKAARDRGDIPLHIRDYNAVHAMAAGVRSNKFAAALLEVGVPERSLYWTDEATGVRLRARPDWLRITGNSAIVVDFKTTAKSASPAAFRKSVADFGYHQQHAWYVDAVAACYPELDVIDFVFIVQSKKAPYLASVCQLDAAAVDLGRERNRRAIDLYAHCTATNTWPGFDEDIHPISLPPWAA